MPSAKIRQVLSQNKEQDRAQHRSLKAADPANHNIEDDKHRIVDDAEGRRRRDAQLLQRDDRTGEAEERRRPEEFAGLPVEDDLAVGQDNIGAPVEEGADLGAARPDDDLPDPVLGVGSSAGGAYRAPFLSTGA